MLETTNNYFFLYAIVTSLISFFTVYLLTPISIKILVKQGKVVQDYHKAGKPKIPRPAGPVLILGLSVSLLVLFVFTYDIRLIAILLTTVIAFVIGYVDDRRVMPGWFKPLSLIFASLPLLFFGSHGTNLNLIFGDAFIPLLYIPLILIAIPIIGNTINSIDVLNGVATGFILISMIPLMISIYLFGTFEIFIASLIFFFAILALYKYHKFPSKIFPGDSGTLVMGSMFGALAIAGNSEIIAIISLLPAVLNSFLFLASVKKIVEHREINSRPTILLDDLRLAASKDKKAPTTLLRLILADGALTENEIIKKIFKLAIFSSFLAIISIAIQYYFVVVVK